MFYFIINILKIQFETKVFHMNNHKVKDNISNKTLISEGSGDFRASDKPEGRGNPKSNCKSEVCGKSKDHAKLGNSGDFRVSDKSESLEAPRGDYRTAASKGKERAHEGWKFLAPICVIFAGIFWGIIGLFSNPLSDIGFSSMQITFLRCLVSALSLLIVTAVKNPMLFRISLRDIWMFVGTGIISIVFFNVCYFISIQESTLSVACTLLYTGPCFVMILSCILFHEKFTVKKAISLCIAVTGCAFITGLIGGSSGAHITPFAFMVGIGSGLGYGLYSIFGRIALKKYHWLTVITYTFSFAALSLLPFCRFTEISAAVSANSSALINILLLGLLSTLTPFLLYTNGLDHMETSKAAMFTFVEPLFATIISIAVFHEGFSLNHAIGMAAIVFSITILNVTFRKSRNPKKKLPAEEELGGS